MTLGCTPARALPGGGRRRSQPHAALRDPGWQPRRASCSSCCALACPGRGRPPRPPPAAGQVGREGRPLPAPRRGSPSPGRRSPPHPHCHACGRGDGQEGGSPLRPAGGERASASGRATPAAPRSRRRGEVARAGEGSAGAPEPARVGGASRPPAAARDHWEGGGGRGLSLAGGRLRSAGPPPPQSIQAAIAARCPPPPLPSARWLARQLRRCSPAGGSGWLRRCRRRLAQPRLTSAPGAGGGTNPLFFLHTHTRTPGRGAEGRGGHAEPA